MKRLTYAFMLTAATVLAASCSKEIRNASDKGEGSLTLSVELPAVTKAAMSSDELVNSASVKIYMADFSGLVRQYTYADAPSTIYLPADSYRVDVLAGEAVKANPAVASWDQKSYAGSKEFTIAAGQNSSVQVAAGVCNAVTKLNYDATVAENFNAGYSLTIGLDASDASTQLVYDAAKSGKEGYFIISGVDEPTFSWTFNGTLAKDGSTFTKSGVIENLEPGKLYTMNLVYTIKDGLLGLSLLVDYGTDIVDDVIVFEATSTGLAASSIYEIWAGHATVHADVDESEFGDPSAIKFAYTSDGSNWTSVDAVRNSEGSYSAVLRGLTASTEYTYKLVIAGEDQGEPRTFTTEASPNVPNPSFEYVSLVAGASYYKWYDPSCGVPGATTQFWGSGNGEGNEGVKGSASMGMVITYVDETEHMDGARSVRAQSGSILGMLAAGNIFTGHFAGLVGTSGGKVCFGRPWTSRPTAIRLWVKYTTDKVNIIGSLPEGADLTKNDYDRANIKIALGTWNYKTYGGDKDCPILVNTTDASTFVDYRTDPSTIADAEVILYGDGRQQINSGEIVAAETTQWRQITIPLEYHTENEYPTHIVISGAASMYGDYFSGSDKSKLWLDGVELLYE